MVHHKKRRRLLPFTPSEDTERRLEQMGSLASALTSLNMEYSDDLTYSFDMAPRRANLATYEKGGMQVLSKEDTETLEYCSAMLKRGECPPLLVIFDSCEGMMTLLLASNPSKSLVICPDKRGNIARFINGINNFSPEAKKKQNLKCVRYSVNGECRVLLVATRDIAKGERLYYDYNGYEHEYPTHHFV
ncbi:hypothetical protein M8C21_018965 [Ambrosia artemisiifolia]|uniref:SET domain-containing protein n=1 Tax=Ambrosia artemisiifolia TaxID=4212 RepID=A0AAD5GBS2_AMBAR|nr:hypothetical protein M8C21_018965 [Ambrosia artemisiifolia]